MSNRLLDIITEPDNTITNMKSRDEKLKAELVGSYVEGPRSQTAYLLDLLRR